MKEHVLTLSLILMLIRRTKNVQELYARICKYGISKYMVLKIAKSGLRDNNLKTACNRDPIDGRSIILTEKLTENVVTNKKAILDNIRVAYSQ